MNYSDITKLLNHNHHDVDDEVLHIDWVRDNNQTIDNFLTNYTGANDVTFNIDDDNDDINEINDTSMNEINDTNMNENIICDDDNNIIDMKYEIVGDDIEDNDNVNDNNIVKLKSIKPKSSKSKSSKSTKSKISRKKVEQLKTKYGSSERYGSAGKKPNKDKTVLKKDHYNDINDLIEKYKDIL